MNQYCFNFYQRIQKVYRLINIFNEPVNSKYSEVTCMRGLNRFWLAFRKVAKNQKIIIIVFYEYVKKYNNLKTSVKHFSKKILFMIDFLLLDSFKNVLRKINFSKFFIINLFPSVWEQKQFFFHSLLIILTICYKQLISWFEKLTKPILYSMLPHFFQPVRDKCWNGQKNTEF